MAPFHMERATGLPHAPALAARGEREATLPPGGNVAAHMKKQRLSALQRTTTVRIEIGTPAYMRAGVTPLDLSVSRPGADGLRRPGASARTSRHGDPAATA